MKKYSFASLMVLVVILSAACGKDPFTSRTDAVFSPHGSVPTGMAIYSPDGNYYGKEVEPYDNGHFGLFNNSTDKMIRQINLPIAANDVKGLAFASNSRWLAVMYHELGGSRIYIVDVETGKLLIVETLSDWYHFMAFKQNSSATLVLALSPKGYPQKSYTYHELTIKSEEKEVKSEGKEEGKSEGKEESEGKITTGFQKHSGANLPWKGYGHDLGPSPYGKHDGFSSILSNTALDEDFAYLASKKKVGLVRVFLFCDLRAGLEEGKNEGKEVRKSEGKEEKEEIDPFTFKSFFQEAGEKEEEEEIDPFTNRTDAVFSPHGSTSASAKAYSPDDLCYVKEVEPFDNGHIGLFNNDTDKLIRQIDLPITANDVKGLAFASNSRWLAVMYHESGGSSIYIVDVETGKLLTTETLSDWYHFMAFKRNSFKRNSGATLVLALSPKGYPQKPYAYHKLTTKGKRKIDNSASLAWDPLVYADMDTLIAMAKKHGLLLMPVLLDFHVANGIIDESGHPVGERPDLLTTRKTEFLTLLAEFLTRYGSNPAIYCWDVMNEPEYVTAINQSEVKSFCADVAALVHQHTTQLVTVGSKSWQDVGNWQGIGLDIYQFHHYDGMPAIPTAISLGLDKPVIVGELQPTDVTTKLSFLETNGYLGVLFWSLNANHSFRDIADEFAAYF